MKKQKKKEIEKAKAAEKAKTKRPETPGSLARLLKSPFDLAEDSVIGLLCFSVALLFSTHLLVNFTLPKLLALRLCTLVLTCFWIFRIRRTQVRPLPRLIQYTAIIMGLWWILTTFFALHKPTAIHGVYGRYNGLLTHETWLLLFFIIASVPRSIERVERILKVFAAALIPVSVYALMQALGYDMMDWVGLPGRSASTIGHPVMLAALMGLALPFVITFFFRAHAVAWRICWGLTGILFLAAAAGTMSRGPLLGIIISCAGVLALNLRSAGVLPWKRLALAVLSLCILGGIVLGLSGTRDKIMERLTSSNEVRLRLYYYATSLNIIRDYPVAGVGLENFRIVYPRYRTAEENEIARDIVPTMVHNGYLQTAVTSGIFALVLYAGFIWFVLIFLFRAYKGETGAARRALLGSFIASIAGFLIQDLTGWMEISLTTFFWLILGLALSFAVPAARNVTISRWARTSLTVLPLFCLVGLMYLSLEASNRVYANWLFWKAGNANPVLTWREAESAIHEGLEVAKNDFYYEDMAATLYTKRFNETGDAAAYEKAAQLYEQAQGHNPYDAYVLIHRVELDSFAVRKGLIGKATASAEQAAAKALSMDRNNPSVYGVLSGLRLHEKRIPEALVMLDAMKQLGRENKKTYLTEGDIHMEMREYPKAASAYQKAAQVAEKERHLPPEWANAKYGYVLSLIQVRDFTTALEELKGVIRRFPYMAASYLIMGDIYLSLNEPGHAMAAFRSALRIEPGNQYARMGYARCQELLKKDGPKR
jgi:putative inorganic carbon (hco3(-)) transporter